MTDSCVICGDLPIECGDYKEVSFSLPVSFLETEEQIEAVSDAIFLALKELGHEIGAMAIIRQSCLFQ